METTSEYPALIISSNLSELYRNIGQQAMVINICNDVHDLRNFLAKYHNVVSSLPIVLSDLSRVSRYQSLLLKFIEESKSPILVLSSTDCVSRVLLSRFKTVVKYPDIIKNSKDDISLTRDKLTGEASVEGELSFSVAEVIKYSPSVFPVLEIIKQSNMPVKTKIRRLLF